MGAITDGYCGLVMELMPWGSMQSCLVDERRRKYFNDSKLLRSLLCVCRGGAYLASVGVIHRDISSKNVFVDVGFEHVKLGDFGISSLQKQHELDREDPMYGLRLSDTKTLFVGVPAYKAPELLCSRPVYSESSDVFAFSIVAWEMLTTLWTGRYARPWSDLHTQHALEKAILSGKRPPLDPSYFSIADEEGARYSAVMATIEWCWDASRHKRPTFLKAHDAIELGFKISHNRSQL
jgi:serine/threonine protein kinase